MPLTEQEELELLELEEEEAMVGQQQAQPQQQGMDKRQQVANRTSAQAANILNSLLLGVPQEIAKRGFGQNFVNEADLTPGDKQLGQIIGSLLPMGAVVRGAGGLVKGAGMGMNILRGAVAGGVAGAVLPPETSFIDLQARGKQAVLGSLIGSAAALGEAGIGKIGQMLQRSKPKEVSGLMKNIRNDFYKVKQDAVDKFGSQVERLAIEKPNQTTTKVREIVDELNNSPDDFQQALPILKKIPGFKEVLAKPKLANSMEAGKIQEWINHLNTKVPQNIKANNIDLLDFISDLKAAQLEAYPEMEAIRTEYAKVIQPFKQLKGQFKFNRLQGAIENNFGGAEGKKAMEEFLPKETIDKIGGYKKTVEHIKFGKEILMSLVKSVTVGAGIGGAYTVGKRILHE